MDAITRAGRTPSYTIWKKRAVCLWRHTTPLATIALIAASLAGFVGRALWLPDLASHFRVQYAVLLSILLVLHWLERRPAWALPAGSAALLNVMLILPLYAAPVSAGGLSGDPLKAISFNLNFSNRQPEYAARYLIESGADVIVLLEYGEQFDDSFAELLRAYPYRHVQPRLYAGNILLLSKTPITLVESFSLGSGFAAGTEVNGRRVTVLAIHAGTPISPDRAERRNRQFDQLALFARSHDGPMILLGDLNVSPWSPNFSDLVRDSRLRNAREGQGLWPTWPTFFPLLQIPIDHFLISDEVVVTSLASGPVLGSDHKPLELNFLLANEEDRPR